VTVRDPRVRAALPAHVQTHTVVGSMALPAGDRVLTNWILSNKSWEPVESGVLAALIKRGAHVVDIGAHVGYMTLLAAARVGPDGSVLAIEAHPGNVALLRENITQNGLTQAEAIHGAAWRRSGETLALTVSPDNSGDHRVFRREGATETIEVPSVALDDLLADDQCIDVVKIDAQGTDHVAVEGMQRTLARCRPVMLVEFWPPGIEEFGDGPADVLGFYRGLGYDIAMLEAPGLSSDAPLEMIVDHARRCPGEFCTLVLQPMRRATSPPVDEVVEYLLTRGPVSGPRSALGPAGPLVRRLALRAMKPYTAYQQVVDGAIVRGLHELSRRLEALEGGDGQRPSKR
jgi:FkbM family methyltransferase